MSAQTHHDQSERPPCENVTKALARTSALQWLIIALIGLVLGGLPIMAASMNSLRGTTDDLSARMKVAEDRYNRDRQDFAEIKALLKELDAKLDGLRHQSK